MPVKVLEPEQSPLPDEILARWRAIPVPVAVDLAPDRQVDPAIRPILPPGVQPALFGRAVTVRCTPPDFGSVLLAVGRIRAGEVLVIDAGGATHAAMIGDVLGGHLHRVGAAGIVCDGAVRDAAGLAAMPGLAVFARAVNPKGPDSAAGGETGSEVTLGGCAVAPGDLVLGDSDGVVVLTSALALSLIDAAEAKLALEARWTARLAAGESVEAIFNLAEPA